MITLRSKGSRPVAIRFYTDFLFTSPMYDSRKAAKTAENRTKHKKESKLEKIAITSEGPTLDDVLDPRFGRAAGYIIVDPRTLQFQYVDNGGSQARAQGAGIQAAEVIIQAGANVVLTGYVGPKAFTALQAAGIKVGRNLDNMTVREAVERYRAGQVAWAAVANSRGHGR